MKDPAANQNMSTEAVTFRHCLVQIETIADKSGTQKAAKYPRPLWVWSEKGSVMSSKVSFLSSVVWFEGVTGSEGNINGGLVIKITPLIINAEIRARYAPIRSPSMHVASANVAI